MWRSAVPLKMPVASGRGAHAGGGARGGGEASAEATVEVNKVKRVFDFAGWPAMVAASTPAPGTRRPTSCTCCAAAAEVAVRALAVLCRQAQDARGAVDRAAALGAAPAHRWRAPRAAADPFPQSGGFDRDQTACSKCRADYDGAPFPTTGL